MHLLIWIVILSSLCSNWPVNYSFQLQEVKYYLLVSLLYAYRPHCNSNLSYFAMDIFLSVRMFAYLYWSIYLECKGYSRLLKWSSDKKKTVIKNWGAHPLGSPFSTWNSSFTLQVSIQTEIMYISMESFWHWAWLCQGQKVKLAPQPRGNMRDTHSAPSPGP